MQQRETATDRLADVIQVIQLGRRTGVLTVERGRDSTFEEGTITFVNGRITQARVGSRQGVDALNWLNTWRQCLFAFVTSTNQLPAPGLRSLVSPNIFAPTTEYGNGTPGTTSTTGPLKTFVSNGGIPSRIIPVDEALSLAERIGLSRTHRRLLLLIDGQRTAFDFVRLMGRSIEEIVELLEVLERAGLIRQ